MRGTLVGRDELIDAAFAALHTSGRVLIDGPAGIGKTAVLHELMDGALARGMTVLWCAPAEIEATLPFAALTDLLGPLTDTLGEVPAPQRHAVRSALLLQDDPAPVDERALASAVRTVLDNAAAHNPAGVLVAIDDAPWLDPPSERAIGFALRRSSHDVRVLVTRRITDEDDHPVPLGLDARDPVEQLHLSPLTVGPLHRLLAERFGVSLSRSATARLARESGGNPLLAIEMTRAALRLPRMPTIGGDLPVPASMHDLVAASLATLPPDVVHAVQLAALLATPELTQLAAAGVDADVLDAAEEIGLVAVENSGRIRFLHPTYASAVRADIPNGVRRRLHALLARTSTDRDELARQLAQCTTEPDDAVAVELGAAAARARLRGAPDLAVDLYERAATLTLDPARATALRIESLGCLFASGSYHLAAEQADSLARDLRGDQLAETLLVRAAIAFSVDDPPLAIATARRALAAAVPSSPLAGRIHAHLAIFVDAALAAHEHAEQALLVLDGPALPTPSADRRGLLGRDDRALLASALLALFFNEVRVGLPPRVDVLDRALELEDGQPAWLAGTIPAIWWKATDQHARARERLQWMLEAATAEGDEPSQHELMQHLAEAEILAGNYRQAARWVADATELAGQLGAATASERWLGGMLDAYRGNLDAARRAGADGLAEAAVSEDPWVHRISLQLSAFVALAEGRTHDAAYGYGELDAAMLATGLAEPLSSRHEPDWLEACVAIGDIDTARLALDRLTRRHDRHPKPWTTLALARSRVLLAGAAGQDAAALIDVMLAARESIPADVVPLDRARCLLVAGLAHRRARRKRAARDALLAAAAEFDALEARGFAARARVEAGRTGARTSTPNELSASELRVAELAAAGATNREIADALFISPKTVEANLARVYRKLAIGRRAELNAALDAQTHSQT